MFKLKRGSLWGLTTLNFVLTLKGHAIDPMSLLKITCGNLVTRISNEARRRESRAQENLQREAATVVIDADTHLALNRSLEARNTEAVKNQARAFIGRAKRAMGGDEVSQFIFNSFLRNAALGTETLSARNRLLEGRPSLNENSKDIIRYWGLTTNVSSMDDSFLRKQILDWWQRNLSKGEKKDYDARVAQQVLMSAWRAKISLVSPDGRIINEADRLNTIFLHFAKGVVESNKSEFSTFDQISKSNPNFLNQAVKYLSAHLNLGGNSDPDTLKNLVKSALVPNAVVPEALRLDAEAQLIARLSGGVIDLKTKGLMFHKLRIDPPKNDVSIFLNKPITDSAISVENGFPLITNGVTDTISKLKKNILRPLPSKNGESYWVLRPLNGNSQTQSEILFFDDYKEAKEFCLKARKAINGVIILDNAFRSLDAL